MFYFILNKKKRAVKLEQGDYVFRIDKIGRTKCVFELVVWDSEHIVPYCYNEFTGKLRAC